LIHGRRRPLPSSVALHSGPSRTGEAEPSDRRCVFVGTTDERDTAEAAPGFENRLRNDATIPQEERQVLEALYKATDGDHWKHHVGWMGAPGTACDWRGVVCGRNGEQAVVTELDLAENNLIGRIPDEITKMVKLESLTIFGNHLSGRLPGAMVERWLAGSLWISAEAPLLTDVSEIDFESAPSALLCGHYRMVFQANTSAVSYTRRCRNATLRDRTTYCEVKQGRIWWEEFARLAWTLEQNGFFALKPKCERNITHAAIVSTRVNRLGKSYEVVDYAGGGPLSLWAIHRSIEGVGSYLDWKKSKVQCQCPAWAESLNSKVPD
jgi:hypothetical protein